MTLNTLEDLYLDQLLGIYGANRRALEITRELAATAADDELREALQRGVAGIADGLDRIGALIEAHGGDPARAPEPEGMEGLVREARAHAIEEGVGNSAVRDALIITEYQRMVHYAIAGYGCLAGLARRLDLGGEADTLQDCLERTRNGDREMSRIATGEGGRAM